MGTILSLNKDTYNNNKNTYNKGNKVLTNDQINDKLSNKMWNIIKKDIEFGKLNIRVKADTDCFQDRCEYIMLYINEMYLKNSGLMIKKIDYIKCSHNMSISVEICDDDDLPKYKC